VHSNFLGQHVENGSVNVTHVLQQLAQGFASHGISIAPARALGTLAALVQRESNVLAYIDGFWICFSFAILALLVVSLMTRAPPGPFTGAVRRREGLLAQMRCERALGPFSLSSQITVVPTRHVPSRCVGFFRSTGCSRGLARSAP
jgi:hypothetical protein